MTRKITISTGEFYHVYNRGTEKRIIFLDNQDYDRFLLLLYICNGEIAVNLRRQGRTFAKLAKVDKGKPLVGICVYCLMPNHFHFVLYELNEGGVALFMQKLITAYTMYFNKKYSRSGVLFQGKYKAVHINSDSYFQYLIAYIHLNPVKLIEPKWKDLGVKNYHRVEKFMYEYPYSSYQDYLEIIRDESCILNKNVIPKFWQDVTHFKDLVMEWLKHKPLID